MINKITQSLQILPGGHGPLTLRCLSSARKLRRAEAKILSVNQDSRSSSLQLRDRLLPSCLPPRNDENAEDHEASPKSSSVSKGWLSKFSWSRLTLQQRAYTILLALVLLAALFRILLFAAIAFEKAVVAFGMGLEEMLVSLVFRTAAAAIILGVVGLAVLGVYIFAKPGKDR
ncbi:hypothetical protein DUNSADRAFT_12410 [Dunaliella salina]|uniref:Uncharacterized protein n=1 Tax=Dunaliella salina TaxID=3046 RepID=A0ABQ7GBA7_DUNSA|nr:hypothetical protein DUNSADRAFT_12410 [Dunaliella salina]|eukprot:KAF5831899.1 hypothetical protein DUNSADRAFT_12410 [Dunaliella salina]